MLLTALLGALALGTPAVAQDHVHDVSATVLPHNIPDFCAVPGAVMSAASGDWTSPATWSNNTVPGPNDVRVIAPGHTVTIGSTDPTARVLCVEGSLQFATNANTKLTVGTMLVKPTGSLEVGSVSAPIAATNTAEIVISDTMLNDPLMPGFVATGIDGNWVADPEQYGTGIISLGKTTIHGTPMTPTWMRVAAEPKAGDTTITLKEAVTGWRAGDRIILPDTRHLRFDEVGGGNPPSDWTRLQGQWEELTIASVSGKTITLTSALEYNHDGARDADDNLVLLPHVGNLSRNVVIRSDSPINAGGIKGHVLLTARADVDIRYALFRDLGRTRAIPCAVDDNNNQLSAACSNGIEPHVNQLGRYPMHFHHLLGPTGVASGTPQFTFTGNAVDGGTDKHTRRWAVAIHATHYGLISENVAYNYAGALFNTEDGTESYNVIENNFAVRSAGTGGRLGFGNEGMGFWFRGPNNYVRGNVAADFDSDNVEAAYGYKYFMHGNCPGCDSLANIKIPTAPGQDPSQYTAVSGNSLPILQFENNEVYSAAEGLTYWWLSSSDPIPAPNPKPSVFKDLRIWHVYNIGIYHYPGSRVLFDGLQIYGDNRDNPENYACCGRGFHGEDYAATDIRIINSKIHNVWSPFIPSAAGTGRQIIENTELKNNRWSDVGVDTMFSANGPDWLPKRKIILNNNTYRGAVAVAKEWFLRGTSNQFQTDQLFVYNFRGNAADDFELFYDVQATSAFAGGIAPCNTTREGVQGLACQTNGSRGPVITWLDPWQGAATGGTVVQISGANFAPGVRVTFDGAPATVLTFNPNTLTVRAPAHAEGAVAVRVANSDLLSDELPANYIADTTSGPLAVPIGFTFSNAVPSPGPVNIAPIAVNDSYVTSQGTPLGITAPGVLGNDSDSDGDTLSAVLVSGAVNGTLTLNGNGSFTYLPNPGFSGSDSFTYKANDGTDDSNIATVSIIVNAVNHAPVANDDVVSMQEDGAEITINPVANDTDADGDRLSSTLAGGPDHGALRIGAEGRQYFYRPNANFCGTDFFDYLLSDGKGGTDTGRVTITVNCVNDAPQPVADFFEVSEDNVNFVLDVLANDVDVDGHETLKVQSCQIQVGTDNPHGQFAVAADRSHVTYTPDRNYSGPASFTCTITDGINTGANAPSARVSINVLPVNDAPVAADQAVTTNEDVAKSITLGATDIDSTALTFTIASAPQHGTLTGTGPNVTYTPAANFSGLDSFAFHVSDGVATSNIATVSMTVNPVNDAPIANAQSVSTAEDTPKAIVLVASDVDNSELTYTVSAPQHGTLSGSAPNVTYTPNADYFGPDSFTFTASDGSLSSAPATVSITVTAVNDAPVAADQAVTTNEDTAATIALSATDVDNDSLSFTIVSAPANGTATISGGSVIYTPAANFNGSDSFTFKAHDGTVDSNIATVSIAVTPVNDAPVAASQAVTTDEDTAAAVVLAATDVEGSALSFTIVSGPAHGTLSGSAPNLTYTPAANYNGADSFTFQANDGTADSNIATVSIAINPVNDAPVAVADAYEGNEDQALTIGAPGVLGNDTDVDSEATLTAMLVGQPAHGTLILNPNGSFTYTPAPNYSGPDSFTYKANDGTVDSNVVTVSLAVNAVNDAPVAQNATASTDEDAAVAITLVATDEDSASLTFTVVSAPQHGTVTIAGNVATYTPNANVSGADSFTFKANDGAADSNVATVSVSVIAVNDAPVAVADAYSVDEDQTLTAAAPGVLGNDTDIDSTTLTAALVSGPSHGTLALNADGSFSYTPEAGFSGSDSFSYSAHDGSLSSNVVAVSITVTAVNDAPAAENQSVSTDEDTTVAITLAAADADSPALTYAIVSGPAHGTLSGVAPNVIYAPAANYNGPDSFTFKANDGALDSNVATVSIVVSPVNDAPVAVADAYSIDEDQVLNVPAAGVLGNDTDVEGDSLTAFLVSGAANGTVVLDANGSFSYTPNAGFNGADSFSYLAKDGSADSNVVTVTIAVTAVNDAPVAIDQALVTNEDTPLSIALAATDGDSNPSALTFEIVSQPQHGTLSGVAPNLIYTPADNYFGGDSFTFKANDGSLDSNVATVAIAVAPVNDAPTAADDSYAADQGQPLAIAAPGVLANDGDIDGPALSAVIEAQPEHGALTLNADGSFVYVPAAGFSGPDRFTYRASDGTLSSEPATVAITVFADRASQDAAARAVITTDDDGVPGASPQDPIETSLTLAATPGEVSIGETAATELAPQGFTLFDFQVAISAPPGTAADPLIVAFTLDASVIPAGQNAGTIAVFRNGALVANCSAAAGASASPDPCVAARTLLADGDVQLTIRTSAASIWNFAVSNDNTAPMANDDEYSTSEETPLTVPAPGVLGNDADADGNTLTASLVSNPSNGTVTFNADGSFSYSPNANFAGSDSFTYQANDGREASNVATVTINVAGVNDAPSAVDDSAATAEDAPVDVPVVANDIDPDGDNAGLHVVVGSVANVRGGTATLLGDRRTVRFTPAAGANDGNTAGGFGFTYQVTDGGASSANEGVVTISVSAVNDAPEAAADSYTTAEDTALEVAAPGVLANDTDGDGDSLSAHLVSGPAHGSLTLNANGSFHYEPAPNYSGPDSFVYKASDGALAAEATVSITVTAVNDAPVALGDNYATDEDTVLDVAAPGVLGNDTDADDDDLTAAIVTGPVHGTLTLNANGSFRYTPAANYHGSDSFSYKANDGTLDSQVVTVAIAVASVNDAPVARDNPYFATEDTELVVGPPGVRGNDTDEDGDTLTVILVSGPARGTLDLKADGTFRYMPAANVNGRDTFTYKVNDGTVDSNVATVVIDVAPVNDAPAAVADSYTTDEDTQLSIAAPGVLGNDTDVDNTTLTAVLVNAPAHGALTLDANGSFIYIPAAGFSGSDAFSYKANDGAADSNTVSVSITVNAVNDAPVAVNDAYTTAEDAALEVAAPGVLGNDTDADGTSLQAVLVSGPAHGTLTLNMDGSFRYVPAANYHGPDSFAYKASDGALEAQATVAITVTPVNDAPTADDDAYSATEDTPLNIAAPGVLDGDADVDGDTLTASVVSGPAHGSLTLNPDGSFSYAPEANFSGSDSFTYRVSDASLESNVATVTIAVAAVDDAPVANAQSIATNEDTAAPIALTATDADSASLTFTIVDQPQHGTLSGPAGNVVYTPAADYNGADSFTFKASDGTADSNVATVTILVNAVNDAPVAADDAFSGVEDQPLSVPAPGVLGNDADVDGDALAVMQVSGPAHGTLALNADGSFTYTPAPNTSGVDTFSYRVSDGSLSSGVATVTIAIAPANDAPVAMNDSYEVAEGGVLTVPAPGVLANDSDIDGDLLTAVLVVAPEHGSIELGLDGAFVYTPEADFNGSDMFTYSATDAGGNSAMAVVQILVTGVNDAPVAVADAYSIAEDGQLDVNAEEGVLSNDTDVERDTLTAALVSPASHGTVVLNADGSFSYIPAANFTGTDAFSYKANDGQADSNVVDVTITVDAVNDAPIAVGDSYGVDEDGTLTIAAPGVLGNDTDTDGDPLAAVVVSQPQHGSLTLNADGSFSYRPSADYTGPDAFSYKANDGSADSNVADVEITVRPVNDAPVAASQSVAASEDTALSIVLTASDVDGDSLTFSIVAAPAHGTLSGTAPNVVYTPEANYNGPDTFTFKANDGTVDSNVATVTIAVGSANDAPAAADDSYSVVEDGTLTVAAPGVLGNDSDPDGNSLSAQLVAAPANGTLTLGPDGSFTYRPAANFSGADSFTYRASDGSADSNVATVHITVTGGNDAPVANDDNYSVAEDATLAIAAPGVLGNDTDADSPSLTVALVGTPVHGTLTLNADGSFTYVAEANFHGSDSFTYSASDGVNASNVGTVTLTVSPVNDPPAIEPILNQGGVVGKATSLQIDAADLDGDTLQYSATGVPPGLVLDPATGRFSGTPTTAATFSVTVTVSDGTASVNALFTWTILPSKVIIAKPSDQRSAERDHVQIQIETTLPEKKGKEKRVFSATGLPPGLKIDQDGEIDGRLKNQSAGVYNVTVTVTLGNTSASAQFKWTVTDVSKGKGKSDRNPYEWQDDRDDRHDNERKDDRRSGGDDDDDRSGKSGSSF